MMRLREFTESVGQAVLDGVGRVASRVQERKPLPADLLESEDAYLAVFDAPGATIDDVQVRYESGAVHVRVDRFREFHEGFDMLFPGRGLSLSGRAELPDDAVVDPREATATLAKNGTLRVEVPRSGERPGTEVSIDAGEDHPTGGDRTSGEDQPSSGDDASSGNDASSGDGASAGDEASAEDVAGSDDDSPLHAEDHDTDVKEPRSDG